VRNRCRCNKTTHTCNSRGAYSAEMRRRCNKFWHTCNSFGRIRIAKDTSMP
jgi:hypothetical protein